MHTFISIALLFFLFVVVCSRWASNKSLPREDVNSQVSNVNGGEVDDWTVISFSIPCQSDDKDDLPISGSRHLLFATGPVINDAIAFHGPDKWSTEQPAVIDCGK